MRSRNFLLLLILLASSATVFAQGPPPRVKEKIGKTNDGTNPFVAQKEIMARFEKEMDLGADVYEKVKKLCGPDAESGESKRELEEKPSNDLLLALIVAVAHVNRGEKTGKLSKGDRDKNLLDIATKTIQRRRGSGTGSGWGGIAEDAGLESPGQLFAIERAIYWGQTFPLDVKKKLEVEKSGS